MAIKMVNKKIYNKTLIFEFIKYTITFQLTICTINYSNLFYILLLILIAF